MFPMVHRSEIEEIHRSEALIHEAKIALARRAFIRQFRGGLPIRQDEIDGLSSLEMARLMIEVMREVRT